MIVPDEIFESRSLAALYDHFNPWSPSDDFYLAQARETGGRILDLGCGTGMLACRIAADGLAVVGVDPADGMLQIARSRPGADKVAWVRGDGQSLRLSERFDLAYMTGHAFQALLTDADAVAVLRAVARHLAPAGRSIVETRNPARQAWLEWTPEESRTVTQIAGLGPVEESVDTSPISKAGIVDITHRYRFLDTGAERIGRSRIRFIGQEHLARLLAEAGLAAVAWYGYWDRQPLSPDSREIIAVTAADRTG